MSYRTLEEKFLADYEQLESVCAELRKQLEELTAKMETTRSCRVLDAAVRAAGRKVVLEGSFISWRSYKANEHDYETWVRLMTENRLPDGVSLSEFIDYFDNELGERYEAQYEKDEQEAGR